MEWLVKINSALDYIEQNLTSKIDLDEICKMACCSSYNFQRMFSFITDITLAEYIRRRKLTAAALELQCSNTKVIGIALKYGYDSATSFARAFNALQGINPSQTYAIFFSDKFRWNEDFSTVLTDMQRRFYSEWLPTANYEKTDSANFEIYGGNEEFGYIELWFPIKKK